MRALVTGFDPFGGDAVNPSSLAVARLPPRIGALDIVTATLPTSFARSMAALDAAIDKSRPDIVLCVGQAGGRSDLCLERVGLNVQDARIADNDGHQPIDEPVVAGGPAAHFTNLPIKACVAALRQAGLPAAVSNTAGTFVCNHILYALMDRIVRRGDGSRGGFLHIPFVPEQVELHRGAPSMAVADIARGIEIILATCARRSEDIHTAEGWLS